MKNRRPKKKSFETRCCGDDKKKIIDQIRAFDDGCVLWSNVVGAGDEFMCSSVGSVPWTTSYGCDAEADGVGVINFGAIQFKNAEEASKVDK